MARNDTYYRTVNEYALKRDHGAVAADSIATTLSVLIPLHHDYGNDISVWPTNAHVVDSINQLHDGKPHYRIWPLDLKLPVITVESFDDLPATTTYGQTYHVKQENVYLETRENGVTLTSHQLLALHIGELLTCDDTQLAALKITAEQHGYEVVVTNKPVGHPDNVAGLIRLREMFNDSNKQLLQAEVSAVREAEQSGWSKPTGKLKFRDRPATRLTRMRNNTRRG